MRRRLLQKRQWTGRARRALLFATLSLSVAACAPVMNSSGATSVACQAFEPIRWSQKDTDGTLSQVKEHNAVGKELCGWGRQEK
jgi:hypothetical protein